MNCSPHFVWTPESAFVYGEYIITPRTIVDHITSFAVTLIGDLKVTNDRIPDAIRLYLALVPWWWGGDIACNDDTFNPWGKSSTLPLTR